MPTYEYGCSACGHRFEEQQRMSDAPLRTCPQCTKDALERLITATAFVLKGGGWYKDGYGSQKSTRTENDRSDRLQKAVDDDKKKSTSSSDTSSSSETTASSGTAASSDTTKLSA
jgi:putative FmdB family regulatory protein